jgi:ribosomal protein S18 acetylase RimI-like enzyme
VIGFFATESRRGAGFKVTDLVVRPFDESDEPNVVALWTEVFGYTEPRNNPTIVIRQKLAAQRELFFVAVLDGSLVGTVMGGYDGHRGWIYSLAVSPVCRQRGIGRTLMQHLESKLRQLGCPKINLQVLASNAATVAFYAKLGYRVEERVSMGKVLE